MFARTTTTKIKHYNGVDGGGGGNHDDHTAHWRVNGIRTIVDEYNIQVDRTAQTQESNKNNDLLGIRPRIESQPFGHQRHAHAHTHTHLEKSAYFIK